MLQEISIESFLKSGIPLIDVRSPGEYISGHIPGSANIPLFSDAERAHIGKVYVKISQLEATQLAHEYVKPKLKSFIELSKNVAMNGPVAVHCWRGGLRSHSFAGHLNENGFNDVLIIKGGYKAYRRYAKSSFAESLNLSIIGGYTGTGKTGIIGRLKVLGYQVIDLENLAHHKGSVFGNIGQSPQPSTEHFENLLFEELQHFDKKKIIWLEDESINIGGVNIPTDFYYQMQQSPLYFFEIPKDARANHLVSEYGQTKPEQLAESLLRLTKRLGGANAKTALEFLEHENYFEVARIALQYYDKSYLKGLTYRNQNNIFTIIAQNTDPIINTALISEYTNYE